ncbi:MAG: hypothetical protein II657_02710 [Clostridiales bacterium]|nr:hypothetical protein [Clostridiales bacterium]
MKRIPYCILLVLSFLFLFGCSAKTDSVSKSSEISKSITSEISSTEKEAKTESSESVKNTEEPSETATSESAVESDDSIYGIIKTKCKEWDIETIDNKIEGESGVDGYYFSEETFEMFEFTYTQFDSKNAAQSQFNLAINNGEIFGIIDETSEELNSEPRMKTMHGHFHTDDDSPEQPDLYVFVQYDNEYFYFYGRGEEQINRVEELCSALNIDLT